MSKIRITDTIVKAELIVTLPVGVRIDSLEDGRIRIVSTSTSEESSIAAIKTLIRRFAEVEVME